MSGPAPRITRRTMLGGAAAAGAGVLLGPAAGAAARSPASNIFGAWVGHLDGRSATIAAPARFALAGLQWRAPAHVRIELRTRTVNGSWSPWALASVTGHDSNAAAAQPDQQFGEPLWVRAADLIQLRSAGPVEGLRVHFVAARVGPANLATAASLPLAQPVLDAGPGQPPIIARSAWAQGHAPPAGPAYYGSIKLAFVHHTVNPNGYSAGEVPSLLLAIFDYHRYVRHFFDIAYNFIVDAFGRIWEARAGGIDAQVIGAHAGAYNAESTGVAMLGTFMSVVPTPAAMQSLQQLLAWKLALHGIPAVGKVRVLVDPADAFYTPFPPGAHVLLPRVAGHRDGDLTDCPGNALYHRLPAIRPVIAQLQGAPAALTVTVSPQQLGVGVPATLSGRLAQLDGTPLAGAPIEIQQLSHDRAITLDGAFTLADGSWSASLAVTKTMVLRALYPVAPAAVSNVIVVGVTPQLTLSLASSSPVRVSGTIAPAKRRVLLDIYRLVRGRRRLVATKTLRAYGGSFSKRVLVGARSGTYVLVASTPQDSRTLAGVSAPLRVTI